MGLAEITYQTKITNYIDYKLQTDQKIRND